MPYPTPLITELNLLFETRSPKSTRAPSSSASSSPSSSTSTLALDDDEIHNIFASNKHREELNPLAAPFVPKSQAQPAPTALYIAKPRVAPPKPTEPIWFDAFSRGACSSGIANHQTYATAIVASRIAWPIEAMAELAQNFCWRGGEKLSEESAGAAPFAFAVYHKFFELCGKEMAMSFIWHLRECVIGAFLVTWDPDCSNSITFRNAPSFNYVASAIAQATFIGQLFNLDLIPGPHTATCMVTLLKGLCSYEHLEALRAIIASAGPTFWHGSVPGQGNVAIHRFVATFLEAVAPLRGNMSVLGRSLKPNEMRDIIVEVEQMVTGWVCR